MSDRDIRLVVIAIVLAFCVGTWFGSCVTNWNWECWIADPKVAEAIQVRLKAEKVERERKAEEIQVRLKAEKVERERKLNR